MIVLDASALIAQLDRSDTHHEVAVSALADLAPEGFGASVLTLAEALVGPARAGRLEQAQTLLRELEIHPIALDAEAATRLARLRGETGLRMPDCCVLDAAALVGAETVVTFDQQLARAARRRGLSTP